MYKYPRAFTLSELVVVTVIIGILSTIGFVSYLGQADTARDSVRLSDMEQISGALTLYLTKANRLPTPTDAITITANNQTYMYQGYVGDTIVSQLNLSGKYHDPKSKEAYSYALDASKRDFQIMSHLEDGGIALTPYKSKVYSAWDYSQTTPIVRGSMLGILTWDDNAPLLSRTLSGTTQEIYDVSGGVKSFFSNEIVSDDIFTIQSVFTYGKKTSCKDILDSNSDYLNQSGNFIIFPDNSNLFEVYCDMNTQGGGWTLVGRWDRDFVENTQTISLPYNAFRKNIHATDLVVLNSPGAYKSATLDLRPFIKNGAEYLMHAGANASSASYEALYFSDIYQSVRNNPELIFHPSYDTNANEALEGTVVNGYSEEGKTRWYDASFNVLSSGDFSQSNYRYYLDGGEGDAMFVNGSREGAVYASSSNMAGNGHSYPFVQWGFYGKDGSIMSYGCNRGSDNFIGTACDTSSIDQPFVRYNFMFIR